MLEPLFPIGLAVFIFGAILSIATTKLKNNKGVRQVALVASCFASILTLAFAVELLFTDTVFSGFTYTIITPLELSFQVDRLSSFFIALVAVVSLAVEIYSIHYIEHMHGEGRKNLLVFLMNTFIVSMILVISSSSMFSFLFFWETMALTSFLLVMLEYEKPETAKAGMFYFVMTHLSTVFLFFAFLFLYITTGTFNIQPITAQPLIASVAFVFLFLGFGIKAGIIPFHKWLPYAHPASPSNISALMSGVMLKVAVYGLIRFLLLLPLESWWGMLILTMGSISALLGVIYALKEPDLKKMLAYSSIENVGIILVGVGLYVIFTTYSLPSIAMVALFGALFHSFNHAVFKSLLFMTTGAVVNSTKTKNIEEMGGLIKKMPTTSFLFLIGAVSISALPPFNGFVSELMIFQTFLQSTALVNPFLSLLLIVALSVFAFTSALAAACFVKAFGISFLALPRSQNAKDAKEAPKAMLIGPAILAILCVGLGVFSYQIFQLLGYSLQLPNMLLIGSLLAVFYVFAWVALRQKTAAMERVSETWGCGITTQTPLMEYSASGFSEPIVTILKTIFRTEKKSKREYYDNNQAVFKSGKAELKLMKFFEEQLYQPIADFIKKVSMKVSALQRGDVDLHIAYAFVAIVIFLLLIWWFA
ncbi:MAG: proton-conducting transporter membrane subunit [Candidatus Bathyarchaeia archaeon]|jgi:formate hydrogenlyase subunit 3/multisubunit Na+/H+ antiporter MnhD subunit